MKTLIQYLQDNNIQHSISSKDKVIIDEIEYTLVEPNEEGLLFTEDFILITDDINAIRYVFCFGGKWYYCDDASKPELNPLKYIGKAKLDFESLPFIGIHGKYEILNGSRQYSDWCKKAKFLGVVILGLCEKNTLAGTLSFQLECKKNNIKSILGATYTVDRNDYRYDIKVYVKNKIGWQSILKLNKICKIDHPNFIPEDLFLENLQGLFIVIDPKSIDYDKLLTLQLHIKTIYYQLDTVEYTNNDRDKWYLENLKKFISNKELNPIYINDAYYLDKEDSHIRKKLNQISGKLEYEAINQYFKSNDDWVLELSQLFNNKDVRFEEYYLKSIENLYKLVNQCNFEIDTSKRNLPKYKMKPEEKGQFKTNEDLFWFLIEKGMSEKCPKGKEGKWIERIQKEYEVITYGNLVDYFLINWDQMRFCKDNKIITGSARGSSAGSLISFILEITKINPFDYDLIFERFLTKGRVGKEIEYKQITVSTNEGELKLWYDDYIKVTRNNKKIIILAKELKEGDDICVLN